MRRALTSLGVYTSSPVAFAVVVAYVALWAAFQSHTLDWHGAATISTLFMTLFVQRASHRDTQAIQGKLDEILHSLGNDEVMRLDGKEPEDIEKHREQIRDRN